MDREADGYGLLAGMVRRDDSFVVRCGRDRNLADEEQDAKLSDALAQLEAVVERSGPLTARKKSVFPSYQRAHPPRMQRIAQLRVSATTATIPRPLTSRHSPEPKLELNVVHVYEVDTPDGEPAFPRGDARRGLLGGHLKRNGDPGLVVLARGLTDLLAADVGYRATLNL